MGLAKKPTLEKDVEKITVCSYLFTIYLIYVLIVWGNELVLFSILFTPKIILFTSNSIRLRHQIK